MSTNHITANIETLAPCAPSTVAPSGLRAQKDDPLPRGGKFAPDPLIFEGDGRKAIFVEMASLASARCREQAGLFFAKGIKETGLVSAMRWREVTVPYSRSEITRAEEIVHARAAVLREEDRLCRAIEREKRCESPNPFELERLELRLCSVRL